MTELAREMTSQTPSERCLREESGLELRCQMLRGYAQHDGA
jgi:hypothetical protein